MGPHLTGPLIGRSPGEEVEDRVGDGGKRFGGDVECPQGVELGDFVLQMLDAGCSRVGFQLIKHRVRLVRPHDEQGIEGGPHRSGEMRRDLVIQRVEKAMKGCLDHPLEFTFGGELNPQCAQMAIGIFFEVGFGGGVGRRLRLQPGFQRLFILGSREAPPGMLPNEGEMPIACAALPGIVRGMIPQQVQLMGNEGADGGGHVLEILWEIAQVLHGLE